MGDMVFTLLALWNLAVFLLYFADKRKAQKGRWRIPESLLLVCSFLGGGVGAVLGMYGLRHKTRHAKFRILVPLALLCTLLIAFGLTFLLWTAGV